MPRTETRDVKPFLTLHCRIRFGAIVTMNSENLQISLDIYIQSLGSIVKRYKPLSMDILTLVVFKSFRV
jgi:hypothetical protein